MSFKEIINKYQNLMDIRENAKNQLVIAMSNGMKSEIVDQLLKEYQRTDGRLYEFYQIKAQVDLR
jgi:hypothetical protein